MSINLIDIPTAVKTYLDTKVTMVVTAAVPAVGNQISPNENFTFGVKATNADAAHGGVKLTNVIYRVRVDNPALATFQVPTNGIARGDDGSLLPAGSMVSFMAFTPTTGTDRQVLDVGESDSIQLTGRARPVPPTGGTTAISARIVADVDMDKLFPKAENSGVASTPLVIIG